MGQLVFKDTQRSSSWNAAIQLTPPPADIFIETGTCHGETLSNAVDVEAFEKRRKEPTRSFEQVLKDLKRDGLV